MLKRRTLLILPALALVLAACTAQPLYTAAPGGGSAATSGLVAVEPVSTRSAQQVRNELVYLLNGNGADPQTAQYVATLTVTSVMPGILKASGGDGESTASKAILTGTIVLRDGDGAEVFTTRRAVSASFDRTTQQFANRRAGIDAENRAARELASQLHAAIRGALARR